MHVRVKSAFGRYRCRLSAIGSQRGPLPLSTFVQSMRNDIRLQSRNPALPVGTKRRPTPAKHQRRWGRLRKERTGIKVYSNDPIQLPRALVSALVFICFPTHFIRSVSLAGGVLHCVFELTHCPARRLFTRTLTSTRRFWARPCAVSLGAAGSAVPIAPGATTCRTGTLQSWIK
jgi:hypothetical protein